MPDHLLLVKAVNFEHTYYDTEDLATIRGANMAPLRLFRILSGLLNQCFGARQVDLCSSRLVVQIPEGQASFAVAAITEWLRGDKRALSAAADGEDTESGRLLRAVSPHLSFVVCHQPTTGDSSDHTRLRDLARWTQARNASVRITWEVPGKEKEKFCQEDQLRPCADRRTYSAATQARREWGAFIKKHPEQWSARGLALVSESSDRMAQSFEEIVAAPANVSIDRHMQGKLAVVYVDGNNFSQLQAGQNVDQLETREQRLEAIIATRLGTVIGSCREKPSAARNGDALVRLELLRWGGDDLVLVVPAWRAWKVSRLMMKPADLGDCQLTFSVSMVIAPHRTPIRRLLSVAGGPVLDRAKARAKADRGAPRSILAYTMATSPDEVGEAPGAKRILSELALDEELASGVAHLAPILAASISGKVRHALRRDVLSSGLTQEAKRRIEDTRNALSVNPAVMNLDEPTRDTLGLVDNSDSDKRFIVAIGHAIALRHAIGDGQ
jgi:hypothetical protein